MTRRLPAALAAAALLLTLVACSSDGEPAPVADDSQTPSATESSSLTVAPSPSETSPPATDTPSADPTPTAPSEPATTEPTKAPPSDVPDTPPATYDDAVARFDAVGQEPQQLKRFESPTGNIYCVVDSPYIPPSCELLEGTIPDPELCGDGPSKVVGRIEFTDGDPQPVCNSDTIREPGAKTLAYGSVAGVDGTTIQCLVETIGVTCINTAATQGFFLARGRYTIFTAG